VVDVLMQHRRAMGLAVTTEDGQPVRTEVFTRVRSAVSGARRFVSQVVMDWELPTVAHKAELVISELATNAVLHAGGDSFRVIVRRLDEAAVRVGVIDCSRMLPQLIAADADGDHGRGLAIVDTVSRGWGTDVCRWGKKVWAELEAEPEPAVAASQPIRRAQVLYMLAVIALAAAVTWSVAVLRP
jgi:anti-sigma regulatory factor (Ser/Thr protein kinase)